MKNIVGKHYQAQRSASEIVKLVKAEIKAKYPQIELSVSKRVFAGGKSIDVAIYDFGYNPFQQAFIAFGVQHADIERFQALYQGEYPIYTDKAMTCLKDCEAILQAYNFDHSDTMNDYFHVNFYGHVSIEENHQVVLYMPDGKLREKALQWYPQLQAWAERKKAFKKNNSEAINPQKKALESPQWQVLHNIAKKGIEVKLFALPAQTEAYRTWLKQKGFRWTSHHVLWYAPFSEALMQQVLEYFKLVDTPHWQIQLKSFTENLSLI